MSDDTREIINGVEVPKQDPGGRWSPEQRMVRVLQSQGMPPSALWTFDETEQQQLVVLCAENGGLCAELRAKFESILADRNERLEAEKATVE